MENFFENIDIAQISPQQSYIMKAILYQKGYIMKIFKLFRKPFKFRLLFCQQKVRLFISVILQ